MTNIRYPNYNRVHFKGCCSRVTFTSALLDLTHGNTTFADIADISFKMWRSGTQGNATFADISTADMDKGSMGCKKVAAQHQQQTLESRPKDALV